VLWAGGGAVVRGRITLGEFVAFQIYLGMLVWPMVALGWVTNLFQRGAASMGRIRAIMDLPTEVDIRADDAAPSTDVTLELSGVGFQYPGTERRVLQGVDLVLHPGEAVAIVGRTGSGKTTLLNLVARLYDPTEGSLSLGKVPAERWPRGPWRRRFGIVPQETFLFSDTIRSNIGFGFDTDEESPDPEKVAIARAWAPISASSPKAWRRCSVSAASHSPEARSSAWPWLGRSRSSARAPARRCVRQRGPGD
jgi:ATP-binding cassette subfamily B protein